jgi:hypothetical protein
MNSSGGSEASDALQNDARCSDGGSRADPRSLRSGSRVRTRRPPQTRPPSRIIQAPQPPFQLEPLQLQLQLEPLQLDSVQLQLELDLAELHLHLDLSQLDLGFRGYDQR